MTRTTVCVVCGRAVHIDSTRPVNTGLGFAVPVCNACPDVEPTKVQQ